MFYYREDKAQLNKLVEAVKTNFNERADEVCNVGQLRSTSLLIT